MKIMWQFSTENSAKAYFSHITIKLTANNYNVGKMGVCSLSITLQKKKVLAQLKNQEKCFKICYVYGKRKPT